MDNDYLHLLSDNYLGGIDKSARLWIEGRINAKAQHHNHATAATASDLCQRNEETGEMLHDMDTVLKFNAIRYKSNSYQTIKLFLTFA